VKCHPPKIYSESVCKTANADSVDGRSVGKQVHKVARDVYIRVRGKKQDWRDEFALKTGHPLKFRQKL
jgi:hypothetical protein